VTRRYLEVAERRLGSCVHLITSKQPHADRALALDVGVGFYVSGEKNCPILLNMIINSSNSAACKK
jgi:hypothetical protein